MGAVCCAPSNRSPTLNAPLRCEYLPVSTVARLGVQMELVTKQLSKRIPSRAMRSMLGVWLIFDPYALIACDAWSSEKMNRMLGRVACACAMQHVSNRQQMRRSSIDSLLKRFERPSAPRAPRFQRRGVTRFFLRFLAL